MSHIESCASVPRSHVIKSIHFVLFITSVGRDKGLFEGSSSGPASVSRHPQYHSEHVALRRPFYYISSTPCSSLAWGRWLLNFTDSRDSAWNAYREEAIDADIPQPIFTLTLSCCHGTEADGRQVHIGLPQVSHSHSLLLSRSVCAVRASCSCVGHWYSLIKGSYNLIFSAGAV